MALVESITPRQKLLTVVVTGAFSLDEAKRHFGEVVEAAAEHKSEKILVDGRTVTGDPTIVERFYYGEFAASLVRERLRGPRERGPQFAYVLHEPVLDPHRFGETVALNRGMYIKVFDNLDEAIEWLGLAPEDV